MKRPLKFTKHGLAEDPRGGHVTWMTGERRHIATVVGVYYRQSPAGLVLKTRYFCGDEGPDVSAGAVQILERTFVMGNKSC